RLERSCQPQPLLTNSWAASSTLSQKIRVSALHREQYATQTRSSCSSISFTPSFPSPLLLLLVYVAVDIRGVVPLRCDHTRLLTRLRAALSGHLQARSWCCVVVNLHWWLARE